MDNQEKWHISKSYGMIYVPDFLRIAKKSGTFLLVNGVWCMMPDFLRIAKKSGTISNSRERYMLPDFLQIAKKSDSFLTPRAPTWGSN